MEKKQTLTNIKTPVVVVMGHIDHGKTTLLDTIRSSAVAQKESGGITQHIGAYQITHQNRAITFLDTPGHEAFSAIRSRGARVADVAVLVVAADEGVRVQTLEAAGLIEKAGLPFVVALTKIDKSGANPDRVKGELGEKGILVEQWGGKIPAVEVSAVNGTGIAELLEIILLLSDIERPAEAGVAGEDLGQTRGVVLESSMDQRRGALATLLIQAGTLRAGTVLRSGSAFGKVRLLEDWDGNTVQSASEGMPVRAVGFKEPPAAGDTFEALATLPEAEAAAERARETARTFEPTVITLVSGKREYILSLVLRADVQGSLDGIIQSFKALPIERVGIEILKSGVGNITDADLKIAEPKSALVIGFRVGIEPQARLLSARREIPVTTFAVIYQLVEFVRAKMAERMPPQISRQDYGTLTVLAVFHKTPKGYIAGGKVVKGKARRGAIAEIVRAGQVISRGRLAQLQQEKVDVEEVAEGRECGILVETSKEVLVGDTLNFFDEIARPPEL